MIVEDYELYIYPNRTVCDVLSEMRKCHETRNYAYLPGLIEECQYLANKMEAALGDLQDIRRLTEARDKLKLEVKELVKKKKGIESRG